MRVLLLLPGTSYRSGAFLAAAQKLGAEIVVASEEKNALAGLNPAGLLTLDFDAPDACAAQLAAQVQPAIDAVIGVDERTAVVAATVSAKLGLRHNPIEAVVAAGDKLKMRRKLSESGIPVPPFESCSLSEDPTQLSKRVAYPCVLKPLNLSASRGVIRANNEAEFIQSFLRVRSIVQGPASGNGNSTSRNILVEQYLPGKEVAVEGLLLDGNLHPLAIFDKPDPLEGPFFEETIYVTPSRLSHDQQGSIIAAAGLAAGALGLRHGPVHVELRINERGPWILEIAGRSIGGRCSRALRFGDGVSLEELTLRHALRLPLMLERERAASGVMMIPIPRGGILREVRGLDEARSVPGVDEVSITAHRGQRLVPWPEGSQYLGFLFARSQEPEQVEAALRLAHSRLEIVFE
ncbi:MAG TPA: ATP-grasp domain-containing protein [Acidobacteriota bacterium]|jgi:biotin carboxylase